MDGEEVNCYTPHRNANTLTLLSGVHRLRPLTILIVLSPQLAPLPFLFSLGFGELSSSLQASYPREPESTPKTDSSDAIAAS